MLADYLVPCKYRAVYMAVTDDAYELPLAIGDNMRDIARTMGVDRSCVCKQIKGAVKGKYKKRFKFVKVYVEEQDAD